MSETGYFVRGVLVLAILSVFVSLLLYSEPSNPIPGRGDVTATVSPWDSLSDTLQTGITFPTFNNPFATGVLYTSLYANASEGTYGNAVGCDNTTFWECLLTDDGNLSYLAISGVYVQFLFNVSEMPSGLEVPTVIITLSCRSTTAQRFRVFLDSFVTDDTYSFSCETGTDFAYTSFALNCVFPSGCRWFSDNLTKVPVYILTWPDGSSPVGQTDFTFIKLDIYSTAQPACAGNPFENTGCQIARFVSTIARGIQMFMNAVVFVIASLVAVLVFVGSIIVGVFIGILTSFTWFLNPANIGNPPGFVTALMAIALLSVLAFFFLLIVRFVRGSSAGGI